MSSAVPTPPVTPKTSYQGNSKAAAANATAKADAPAEGPKLKKIEGVVKVKKPLGKRIAENFGGENLKVVGKGVLMEVLLPGARDILFDIIKEGAHRSLYGDAPRRSSSGSVLGGSRIRPTSYGAASRGAARESSPSTLSANAKRRFDFSDFLIEDAARADEIINELEIAIEEFGLVTVADLFEALGESGNGYTDRNFGWDAKAFDGAEPKRVRGGWILDIPEPVGIKR